MAKRICLMTGYETNCTDGCYNCDCGGEVALNDYYVPIYNIQRVCDIVKNMDIDLDSAETAEYIRNELERMTVAADVQPVKRGKWTDNRCSICGARPDNYMCGDVWIKHYPSYCPHCGADMRGD